MSDLSSPPPSLVPSEAGGGEAPAAFAWPTPPLACYPVPQPLAEPEPCQIEGLNGKLMNGALLGFDPDAGIAQVRIPPARIAMPLRFGQYLLDLFFHGTNRVCRLVRRSGHLRHPPRQTHPNNRVPNPRGAG